MEKSSDDKSCYKLLWNGKIHSHGVLVQRYIFSALGMRCLTIKKKLIVEEPKSIRRARRKKLYVTNPLHIH